MVTVPVCVVPLSTKLASSTEADPLYVTLDNSIVTVCESSSVVSLAITKGIYAMVSPGLKVSVALVSAV